MVFYLRQLGRSVDSVLRMVWGAKVIESVPPIPVIALNRMGFGPRPGDFEAFAALGDDDLTRLNNYIEQQLHPGSINDSDLESRITAEEYPTKDKTRQELWQEHHRSDVGEERRRPYQDVKRLKFLRALYSKRQLYELLTEFWHDHFNVDAGSNVIRSMIMYYDRDVIRPYALSNFRMLLEAVATSTCMLDYLDNYVNKKTGPNENWARELLEPFGLWEKRDVKVENFSRGMRRRLSIAMAIIHKPALLFLDEPTPGLDAQSARAIRDLIRRMNAEGTTIFLTTHQIEEANQLCDRVAIINYGRIAAIDTPERLKQAFRRVQSVEVALEPDGQTHGQALTALSGVTTAVKMGDKWRLYTEDPSALLPQVMDYARSHDLRVVSLSTLGPSLEDVFLEITGQQVGAVRHETRARGRMQGTRGRRGGRR